jgi:hypothetical protein
MSLRVGLGCRYPLIGREVLFYFVQVSLEKEAGWRQGSKDSQWPSDTLPPSKVQPKLTGGGEWHLWTLSQSLGLMESIVQA